MPTYRSEVIGSLLRPDYLKQARQQRQDQALDAAAFKQIEDRAVDEAIALQAGAGLDVITDGEMRRYAFFGHFIDASRASTRRAAGPSPSATSRATSSILKRPLVVAPLKRLRPMCTEEFVYMRARSDQPIKVTLINAQQAAAYYDAEKSKGAYPTIDAYLADVVDILRAEVDELVRLGCDYIQIDAPQYAGLIDPAIREGYRKRGTDPERLLDRCIELDNAVIGDHPGVTFGIHLCRGNNQSKFYASGGYDPIVGGVPAHQVPALLARVRRRALWRLRAAAACARGSNRGAGAGHDQEAGDRAQG